MRTYEEIAADYENDSRAASLSIHLTSNHYPPVPASMVPTILAACDLVQDVEDGFGDDYYQPVPLPPGVLYKGEAFAPAQEIIEQHHAEAYVPMSYNYEEEKTAAAPIPSGAKHYFAADGNYGDADGLLIVNAAHLTDDDWEEIAAQPDSSRTDYVRTLLADTTAAAPEFLPVEAIVRRFRAMRDLMEAEAKLRGASFGWGTRLDDWFDDPESSLLADSGFVMGFSLAIELMRPAQGNLTYHASAAYDNGADAVERMEWQGNKERDEVDQLVADLNAARLNLIALTYEERGLDADAARVAAALSPEYLNELVPNLTRNN